MSLRDDNSNTPTQTNPDRESLRIVLFGSQQGVTNLKYGLQHTGLAPANAWTPLSSGTIRGEYVSVLILHIPKQ